MTKKFIFLVLTGLVFGLGAQPEEETLLIRISYSDKREEARVRALGLKIIDEKPNEYIETRLCWEEVLKLNGQKFDLTYVIEISKASVDSAFHSFAEVRCELARLQKAFPKILNVRTIGITAVKQLPILAAVLSDNPEKIADRPAVLITGAHHAREPLSTEICLHLIAELCHNFQQESRVTHWLQQFEIWIIPVVNPDGYSLIFSGNDQHQLWRKNLRDNNQSGHFEKEFDGVDLNRNYEYNWELGGSSDFQSPFFKGPMPFSEKETQALKKLVETRQFAFIVDFHSFGEAVLYPWSNFSEPPDGELLKYLAEEMARQIQNVENSDHYEIIPLDAKMGQSSVWHYGKHGIFSFIVESGDTYFPPAEKLEHIISQNARAVFYLLERLKGPRLSGHVREKITRNPIPAKICLINQQAKRLQPIQTDLHYGRFDRVVQPGIYTIEITADGWQPTTIANIQVADSQAVALDIFLEPAAEQKTDNE